MADSSHLHPIFDRVVTRAEKETQLEQRARVIWLFGLSGAGKSTLAVALERRLQASGRVTHLLDGDNIRTGLNRNLGFSDADRDENIRRVAEVAKLFVQAGVITICSFITPTRAQRADARSIIGPDDLLEIYVRASFEACAARDPKGLYAKARAGDVKQFTGRDSGFEPPLADDPGFVIETESESPEASLERLVGIVAPRIQFP
ncbi:adenylyl-sulfate kinase [Opitutaceae bacterium EW11]|nr:adenylyl-sulfate kinase [Opitutaceae bacterium EW11]